MKRGKNGLFSGFAVTAGVAVLLLVLLGVGAARIDRQTNSQEMELLKKAVMRCVGSCYAIEGRYPDSLEYLEDHYGLVYDHEKYIIRYDAFAVNQLPDVAVLARGTAE